MITIRQNTRKNYGFSNLQIVLAEEELKFFQKFKDLEELKNDLIT